MAAAEDQSSNPEKTIKDIKHVSRHQLANDRQSKQERKENHPRDNASLLPYAKLHMRRLTQRRREEKLPTDDSSYGNRNQLTRCAWPSEGCDRGEDRQGSSLAIRT